MERILEPEFMDDPSESRDYDSMDHTLPNAAFVERLIELGAHGTMLDIGCGPGHIPPLIIDRIPNSQVVGLDAAETMLSLAENRRLGCKNPDRISYQQGDAKRLVFPDDSFDVVISNTVMHHIHDPVPFLAEAYRVLKPEGAILIRDLFRPLNVESADALVDLHAPDATEQQRARFHASLCAALTPEELQSLAIRGGMRGFDIILDSDRHMSLQKIAS